MSDPNLVQVAIDFLGAADLEQALYKAYHLLTISTGRAEPDMAIPTMAVPTTHRKQALLKATLKVSKTESYTIELDATKARCNLPCHHATMPMLTMPMLTMPMLTMPMLTMLTVPTSSTLTAPRRPQGETPSSRPSTNASSTYSCAGEW